VCRNIKTLFNYEPPATDEELYNASLQYVCKVSGFSKPSQLNQEAFDRAVYEIAQITGQLVETLVTNAAPKDREIEAAKARARAAKRYS
jgi:hypothetical protein